MANHNAKAGFAGAHGSAAVILAEAYHRHRDEIAEAKRILWDELDRDYDADDSLRTLVVVAVNALHRAKKENGRLRNWMAKHGLPPSDKLTDAAQTPFSHAGQEPMNNPNPTAKQESTPGVGSSELVEGRRRKKRVVLGRTARWNNGCHNPSETVG